MKKNDEMQDVILENANSITLKIVIAILSVWIIYEGAISVIDSTRMNILPATLTLLVIGTRMFLIQHINKRMTSGDPEYKVPSSTLKFVLASIIIVGIVLSLGYLFLR